MKIYKILILLNILILSSNNLLVAQVNFTSSNLPIVIIDTQGQTIPNEPKITADMGIIFNGSGIRNNVTDPFNNYNGKIGIEIRGSSSQMFPKKQYAVETRDASGNNLNVPILGMPAENDWILYAPYSDKSLMRNVLTYKLTNDLGWYASRTRWCELVINGDYKGIYVLMEKIKRDKNRVGIKKLLPSYISGDELTGGYILKIDKDEGSNNGGWASPFPPYPGAWQQIYYQYHYPKPSDIVPEQETYIQNYINLFESTLDGSNYTHPFLGYYDLVNLNSFVDYFIINEIGKNVDGYRLSAFMYKDRDSEDSRLTMGPVWDFNLAFGNADYYNGWITDSWQLQGQIPNYDNWQIPFWWLRLFQDEIFINRISKRWHTLRTSTFSINSLINYIDNTAMFTNEAMIRNFTRWPIIGTYVWPNFYIGQTYDEDLNYLKIWLQARINWIDNELPLNYTDIYWENPENISIAGQPNNTISIPIENIATVILNADSITFIGKDPQLQLSYDLDSLYLNASSEDEFVFKGLAWFSGKKTDISPKYIYSTVNTSSIKNDEVLSSNFYLLQNYPNPFNSETNISFDISDFRCCLVDVELSVFNIIGKKIITLINDKLPPNLYQIRWNGLDNYGKPVPSGTYICKLNINNYDILNKIVLIK